MKKYFYSDGQVKYGPFTIEELKSKGIDATTLVWYEGLTDWQPAGDLDEFVGEGAKFKTFQQLD